MISLNVHHDPSKLDIPIHGRKVGFIYHVYTNSRLVRVGDRASSLSTIIPMQVCAPKTCKNSRKKRALGPVHYPCNVNYNSNIREHIKAVCRP